MRPEPDSGGRGRWIELEGVENVRDLGGLPLAGGGSTRFGQLLRCARLHHLTDGDVDWLTGTYGLRTVIDLRSPREVERDGPTPLERAGVRTEHLTVLPEGRRPIPREDEDPKLFNYRGYLAHRPENVLAAVRLLTEVDAGPALVHCAAGKDRTGVFCALVSDAVGVSRDAVIEDYAMSNDRLLRVLQRGVGTVYDIDPADIELYRCPPEVMAALMEGLDTDGLDTAGGPEGAGAGWLRRQGMAESELATLRARFTG
ncbi:MAG TPA: tyrosine-protein phosphatase [Pseudonocardia sp.]